MTVAELQKLTREIADTILARMDYSRELSDEDVRERILQEIRLSEREYYLTATDKYTLARRTFDLLRKLGPLQPLIEDEQISEIMVNGAEKIFIEKNGEMEELPDTFESEEQLEDVIQKVVAAHNRVVNEANPIVDARLADGSRVHVVLPPIALDGAVLTIRKFPKVPMTMERLLSLGSLTEEMAAYLKMAVEDGRNMIVSGGTSSGKTSFLNALSSLIPPKERVILIEDSAELQVVGVENLVRLETRNANAAKQGEVSAADLIRASLRMRPDRIIVGEVRDGAAAVNLLMAFNTGHIGQSTIHSNSAADTISRLETLVLIGAGNIPLAAVRRQIASAVDIIVHLERRKDGRRCVAEIVELEERQGEICLNRKFGGPDDDGAESSL